MAKKKQRNYKQGTYEVKNKNKYVGKGNPRFLSSFELQCFLYMDNNPNVIEWGSENVVVKYYDHLKEKYRRYMVDLYVKYKDRHGNIKTELVEIKPYNETLPPTKGKKRQDVFENQQMTYITNQEKWKAATEYAKDRGWTFRVITERDIFR